MCVCVCVCVYIEKAISKRTQQRIVLTEISFVLDCNKDCFHKPCELLSTEEEEEEEEASVRSLMHA